MSPAIMPLLKSQLAPPAMREAIVLDLGDLGAQAEKIREQAKQEAEAILVAAQEVAQQLKAASEEAAAERGHAEGLARGLEEGRAQGKQEALAEAQEQLNALTAAWSATADGWQQQRSAMQRDAREAVLDFALRVAEKVVHRVIELDGDTATRQVEAALESVLSAHDVTVRIHPDDRVVVEDALPKLVMHMGGLEHVTLVDDEAMGRGGCALSCGSGEVDATIETQVARIAELIMPGGKAESSSETDGGTSAEADSAGGGGDAPSEDVE